jgi:hypothetical protein
MRTTTDPMRQTQDATPTAAETLAQREADHQRWADDGGRSPDADRPRARAVVPAPVSGAGLPVRVVYRRPAGV